MVGTLRGVVVEFGDIYVMSMLLIGNPVTQTFDQPIFVQIPEWDASFFHMLSEIVHPHALWLKKESMILDQKCYSVIASVCYEYGTVEVGYSIWAP